MARVKPKTEVIADLKQADAAMQELASLERKAAEINAEMNERIDLAKANAAKEVAPIVQRAKELRASMTIFATLNKADLFKKKRSMETTFGTFGFRKSTMLTTLKGFKLADVLERLKELDLNEAITIKASVNKDALRAWTDEKLETVGIKRKTTDEFFIETKQEEINE